MWLWGFFSPAIGGIVVTFFIIWPWSKKIAISCSAFAKPFQDVISTSTLSESILHVGWYIYWILHVKICITCRINPKTIYHPKGHRPEGRYRFWHLMFIISYISTMPLIIHVFYEHFEFLENLEKKEKKFKFRKILKFRNILGIRYRVCDIGLEQSLIMHIENTCILI